MAEANSSLPLAQLCQPSGMAPAVLSSSGAALGGGGLLSDAAWRAAILETQALQAALAERCQLIVLPVPGSRAA